MSKELKHIDASGLPDLLRIAEEVRKTKEPRLIRRDGTVLAVVSPVPATKARSGHRGRAVTREDALFRLIGIGRSGRAGGVSGSKHQHLAKAYRHQ